MTSLGTRGIGRRKMLHCKIVSGQRYSDARVMRLRPFGRSRIPHLSGKKRSTPNRIIIKKYANRRLYNTGTSAYITLEQLCEMVKVGAKIEVSDARTDDDISTQALAQI